MSLSEMPPAQDVLWQHLSQLPAFRALIRAIEHRLVLEAGPLPHPLLDIGCGDGHFGQAVFQHVEAGFDIAHASLREAQRRGVYDHLDVASAWNMPYRSGAFAGAVANCAVEHMPELDQVFGEVARVLRRGGRFIVSVPTDQLNRNLFIAASLDRLGAHAQAERYRVWFKRMQVHYHMYSPAEWQRRLEAQGFRVVQRRGYLSPRATQYLELGHYYGLPNLLARRVTGKWVPWPWRPRFKLEEVILTPRVAEDDVPNSGCCFFVAEKA